MPEDNIYRYKNFDEWFKYAARSLWDVQDWNNQTIKTWLESAFEDGREKKSQ